MIDIAPHVRIFEGSPTDEFVTKRQTAIKDISKKFTKSNNISHLLSVADGLVRASKDDDELPAELASEVAASLVKVSPSFVAEGHGLEISTCALLAAINSIETGSKSGTLTHADYLAAGLWSGMSLNAGSKNASFERLRGLLLHTARDHVLKTAEFGRVRSSPEKIESLTDDRTNLEAVINNLRSAVDTLTANATVDREEIDLLWWSISGWSDILNAKYSAAQPHSAAIALGLDAAKRLRRMPGDLHKALVLRRVPEGDSLSLTELIDILGDDCALLGARFSGSKMVTDNDQVFPLLNALVTRNANGMSNIKLSINDLAARALLESVTFDVIYRREV